MTGLSYSVFFFLFVLIDIQNGTLIEEIKNATKQQSNLVNQGSSKGYKGNF